MEIDMIKVFIKIYNLQMDAVLIVKLKEVIGAEEALNLPKINVKRLFLYQEM